jgi:pimeloyl-ACP methyl ester carboxylesterase
MAMIDANGTQFYYEESGAGPALFFIHGMAGFAGVWAEQRARLDDTFHCVAYDRRGHTRTARGPISQETVELHADDAAALIRGLGLAPVMLVGSSGGARIALDILRRYPELVRGAALSEPPAFALAPALGAEFMSRVKPAVEQALKSAQPQTAVDAFFRTIDAPFWDQLAAEREEMYRANLNGMLGDLQQPLYPVSTADLARIDRPCLMFYGSESQRTFSEIAKIVAVPIPHPRLAELLRALHGC